MQYDYIIVGGGSGGSSVASRLADACPDATIALIEAGPHTERNLLVNMPVGIAALVPFKLGTNYGYETVPQPGLGGRRGYQPRGRGMGGSSAINAMIYTRGHPGDYDEWAQLGATGWGWQDVLPYFRRAEGNERGADAWHGADGPLTVSDLRFRNPFSERFIQAAHAAGYPLNNDFNGATQEGVGFYQVTHRDGSRCSVARAYIYGRNRPNLHVITDATVLRVGFDGKRAVGVVVSRDGRVETLGARAEVILSAGAFNSPQLLMCSGIGPAEQLRRHGIAIVQDAPDVGANLIDHIDFIINTRVNSSELVGICLRGLAKMTPALARYFSSRTGMMTSNVAEAGGFIKSDPSLARPDLQPKQLFRPFDTLRADDLRHLELDTRKVIDRDDLAAVRAAVHRFDRRRSGVGRGARCPRRGDGREGRFLRFCSAHIFRSAFLGRARCLCGGALRIDSRE